ncbi:copper resistance CopC/CopD family protein [Lapillicoccus jejuensis]|uniref:Copper transport protein n=1 Tax=Lapillicoccus jejuensis TaxID=402171 RepID=A0A542E2X8_9MICO|nr:copper resistance protein CopC [Lapillicoccus jejuensis]TQJ09683.1 copper transport protein [Lapillicoccus jejuensis]
MHRRARALAVLLLAVLVALVAPAPTASAHAYLDASNPADGSVLEAAPTRLALTFDEGVVPSATTITLVASDGSRRTLGPVTADATSDDAPASLSVPLPALSRGAYQVAWSTVSADDLHPTGGTFGFGVGVSVAAVGWTETAPSPLEGVLRALLLVGLLLAVGAPFASDLVRRRLPSDPEAAHPVARTAGSAAALAALAGLALLVDELVAGSGGASAVLLSRYGAWWGLRELALLTAAAVLLPGRSAHPRPAGTWRAPAGSVAGLVAALATAVLGHSGSGATGSPARVALATLHVLSAAAWLGTLALLVVLLAVRRPGRRAARHLLRGLAPVAVAGATGMAVTGIALASGVVGSLDALLLTDYGRLLLAKVAVVGLLLAAGLVNHRRLRARGTDPGRLVRAEVVGGLVVLVLTGLLTSGQPATERQLQLDPAATASMLVTRQVGDLQEELTLRPNLPGRNLAVVRVADTRRPSPGPVTTVSVGVTDAAGRVVLVRATPLGDGRWSAPVDVAQWGQADVRVVVARRGVAAPTTADLGWTVAAPPGTPAPAVSRTPLGGPLTWAAWGMALLALAGAAVLGRRVVRRQEAERRLAARAATVGLPTP